MRFPVLLFVLLICCLIALPQDKPRVLVTTSESWAAAGGFGGSNGVMSGAMSAGAKPQTVEVIDDFAKNCPGVIVTSNRQNANFVVLFDRDAGAAKRNKIAVFRKDGDLLYSGKTHAVVNAVKDACAAIGKSEISAKVQ